MSERLEALTKQFVVPILFTGQLFQYLTEETQNECRQLDYCLMAGNESPVALFTVDVAPEHVLLEEEIAQSTKQRKIRRVQERIKRNRMKEDAFSNAISISDNFHNNLDLQVMRAPFSEEFYATYNEAFRLYLEGDWERAHTLFVKVLELQPLDHPTERLLAFMQETDFKAPRDWLGHKFLNE